MFSGPTPPKHTCLQKESGLDGIPILEEKKISCENVFF